MNAIRQIFLGLLAHIACFGLVSKPWTTCAVIAAFGYIGGLVASGSFGMALWPAWLAAAAYWAVYREEGRALG